MLVLFVHDEPKSISQYMQLALRRDSNIRMHFAIVLVVAIIYLLMALNALIALLYGSGYTDFIISILSPFVWLMFVTTGRAVVYYTLIAVMTLLLASIVFKLNRFVGDDAVGFKDSIVKARVELFRLWSYIIVVFCIGVADTLVPLLYVMLLSYSASTAGAPGAFNHQLACLSLVFLLYLLFIESIIYMYKLNILNKVSLACSVIVLVAIRAVFLELLW
jgi:hypothetical protein